MLRKVNKVLSLDHYLDKEYPVTIYNAEEGGYVAEIEELPGCITEGDTLEEVFQRIEEAKRLWIQTTFEDGAEIPVPRSDEDFSGRFLTRIPKYLHRRLVEQSRREGVSLNQYVETILSSYVSNVELKDKLIHEIKNEIVPYLRPMLVAQKTRYASMHPSPVDLEFTGVGA